MRLALDGLTFYQRTGQEFLPSAYGVGLLVDLLEEQIGCALSHLEDWNMKRDATGWNAGQHSERGQDPLYLLLFKLLLNSIVEASYIVDRGIVPSVLGRQGSHPPTRRTD